MYNVGDKFIIEIESEYGAHSSVNGTDMKKVPDTLYRMKGFNSLVFDKVGLQKLKPYKEQTSSATKEFPLTKTLKFGVSTGYHEALNPPLDRMKADIAKAIVHELLRGNNILFTDCVDGWGRTALYGELTVLLKENGGKDK